jgi:Outer membrane lipoprotein-sorting protein
MRVPRFFLLIIAAAFLSSCGDGGGPQIPGTPAAGSPRQKGEEIVAEYLGEDAAPYRKSKVRFTITSAGEPEKIYELDIWRRQTPAATDTLSQIAKPAEDAGLGSLTYEKKDAETVSVTYSAARDEFPESDTGKMFFGGLTAQELLGEWGKYDYELLGEKEVEGARVFEVQGKLKPALKSVISKMAILFREDNHLPAEMRLYDSSGKELRVYSKAVYKNDGKHNYVARLEVDNPVYKTHVVIEILAREYPATIESGMFEREILKKK